jgi:hypothetical protein
VVLNGSRRRRQRSDIRGEHRLCIGRGWRRYKADLCGGGGTRSDPLGETFRQRRIAKTR